MRWRSGETLRGESFMALLRLQNKADCLTSQPTKQSLKPQLSSNPQSELPLPRERFSPWVKSGNSAHSKACPKQPFAEDHIPGAPRDCRGSSTSAWGDDEHVPDKTNLVVADLKAAIDVVMPSAIRRPQTDSRSGCGMLASM